MNDKFFVDTNVFLYLLSNDINKKTIAKKILASNLHISTQVINEFSNISLKKFKLSTSNTKELLSKLIEKTIFYALDLKEKYQFQFYDSLILASALENQCNILYSEDMQHNQIIEKQLTIVNPFL